MSERPSAKRRDREEAPTRFTLAPLLEAQVFTAGPGRLACGVGGRDYFADLGEGGEILFEGHTFKSPSAFSVYVKRKVNPSRKADDGWTSVKYCGELLSIYRPKLEELISLGVGGATPIRPSLSAPSPRASPLRSSQPKRKKRRRDEESETSEEWDDDLNDFEASDDDDYKSTHRPGASRDSLGGKRPARHKTDVARAVRDYISNEQQLAELEDGADNKVDVESVTRHLAACSRPALAGCTASEFEEDLYTFLTSRKENELVKHLRNKRITCNNTPIDIFGLYREVVRHGGFVDNERYDDYNRWIGGINFAGQIFPKMSNYTPNNRATSIGNQLLSNYRKFLLAYEIAHRAKDLEAPEPSTTQAASGLEFLANIASGEVSGGEIVDDLDTQKIPKGHRSKAHRNKFEEEEPESSLKDKKRKAPESTSRNSGRRILAALRKIENTPTRHLPGSLLLAQDPSDLNRHWPVLVASCTDVPRVVSSGGATAQLLSDNFPQTLREAVMGARVEDAYPVCIFGSQMMGWVEASSCRLYNLSAGESAMASVRNDSSKKNSALTTQMQSQQCGRALKLAAQYASSHDPLQLQTVPKSMVLAAGTSFVAQKLLSLEGRIPIHGVLCSSSFQFWQQWRQSVESASAPAELTPLVGSWLLCPTSASLQMLRGKDLLGLLEFVGVIGHLEGSRGKWVAQILTLAHQIIPDMLTRNASETLWEDLRYLLDMEIPQGPAISGAAGQSNGVHVLAVDDAVSALEESLDWARILRINNLGTPAGSGLRTNTNTAHPSGLPQNPLKPGRNGVKPESGTDMKNCASNTDLAGHFAVSAGAARPSRGPSPLGQPSVAFSGDDPGTHADADRVSGLQMPITGNDKLALLAPELERIEKEVQVDSTGSAEGQGSMRGQVDPLQSNQPARQPSPENASPLQLASGFQPYQPNQLNSTGLPFAGQQPS